jgi:ubiquinone/menaquinone biosynthesis C-methylase UbiE
MINLLKNNDALDIARKIIRIIDNVLPISKSKREEVFLNKLYNELLSNPATRQKVNLILSVNEYDARLSGINARMERALPGNEDFLKSEWSEIMLTRYALAMNYSKGKYVLDSCSGLGWGSYLLDSIAKAVTAVDISQESLELSNSLWPTQVTYYMQGSVLALDLESDSVDIALAMESIEHFKLSDIHLYLDELKRVLKPGGRLIGSSAFPDTRKQADALCAKNPHHLHICTMDEITDMLKNRFKRYNIFNNRLFFWAEK